MYSKPVIFSNSHHLSKSTLLVVTIYARVTESTVCQTLLQVIHIILFLNEYYTTTKKEQTKPILASLKKLRYMSASYLEFLNSILILIMNLLMLDTFTDILRKREISLYFTRVIATHFCSRQTPARQKQLSYQMFKKISVCF